MHTDIRRNKTTDNFTNKCKILSIDKDKQVEILNSFYKNKLIFEKRKNFEGNYYIYLVHIDESVRILELPEVEDIIISLDTIKNNVITLKLPKTIKKYNVMDLAFFQNLNSLWIYEDTELHGMEFSRKRNINLMILSNTGKKDKFYKNML